MPGDPLVPNDRPTLSSCATCRARIDRDAPTAPPDL
jgi:hypothetical protein